MSHDPTVEALDEDTFAQRDLYDPSMTWTDLSVPDDIIELLVMANYKKPTKTQIQAIKPVFADKKQSGILEAPTGTGKTISFLTIAVSLISISNKTPQVIIIAPTKILCRQIYDVANHFLGDSGVLTTLCLADEEMDEKNPLKPDAHMVIGTIGALHNKFGGKTVKKGNRVVTERGILNPLTVQTVIVDEADFFVEIKDQVSGLFQILPNKVRKYFFSATMMPEVTTFITNEWLDIDNPYFVNRVDAYFGNSIQFYLPCTDEDKAKALDRVINLETYQKGTQSIIFCETRKFADKCYDIMTHNGYKCSKYHSDMPKDDRYREFEDFKQKKTVCLITTNGLARGIDVTSIRLVVNYSPPTRAAKVGSNEKQADSVTYTHRIGRGGRFGRATVSITFCNSSEQGYMKDIMEFMKEKYSEQKRTDDIITPLGSVDEIKTKLEEIMKKVDKEIDAENAAMARQSEMNKPVTKNDDISDIN